MKEARLLIISGQAGRVVLHPEFTTPAVATFALEKAIEDTREGESSHILRGGRCLKVPLRISDRKSRL